MRPSDVDIPKERRKIALDRLAWEYFGVVYPTSRTA